MSSLEERLRDALSATASTVDERIERPLPDRRPTPHRSRLTRPVLAAIAVLMLLAGAVGIRYITHEDKPVLRKIPGMPKFVVAVMPKANGAPSRLEVHDSQTGRLIGSRRISGAHTEFERVVSAGDGRTYYALAAVTGKKGCRTDVFRFSLDAAGQIQTLVPTGLALRGGSIWDLAISPDRTRVAYLYLKGGCSDSLDMNPSGVGVGGGSQRSGGPVGKPDKPNSPGVVGLGVFDFSSRKRSQWPIESDYSVSGLSWLPHSQDIGFLTGDGRSISTDQLRRISLARPFSGGLIKNSTRIYQAPEPTSLDAVFPADDGRSYYFLTTRYKEKVAKGGEGGIGNGTDVEAIGAQIVRVPVGGAVATLVAQAPRPDDLGIMMFRRGTAILHGEASGRYLLSQDGILDLQRGGRPRRVAGLSGAADIAW